MKNLSLKQKLTILYTILMTINICAVLAVLFSLSNREILSSVQNRLRESVAGAFDDIEMDDGKLDFDSDILELENGVYLSVYDMEGRLLYGKIPYGFDQSMAFQDGLVRRQKAEQVEYYVLDMSYAPEENINLMVRGIISITDSEESFRITLRLALICLPFLVILTAVLGYFMTRRTLRPVAHITETVRTIQEEEDLSRRINLGEGRDEIYRLAATFDKMLGQIEDSMKREKQFTSDVSHELRTPLSVILMPGVMVYGDETLLIRLWFNLLQNAVTYGKEGGCIYMSLQEEGEAVTGCVKDDGIGISAEDLPHIWERFYRADSSRNDVGSSGLGLSMVQWIINVHNGTIQAVSEPGRGSTFTFCLPKEKKS